MKKVLDKKSDEINFYIKKGHTQEECIGFIDGFERANELFALYDVSNRRELLIDFMTNNLGTKIYIAEVVADDYLSDKGN